MATVSEGDEVIIPATYWVSYPEMVRMCGGISVIVATTAENGWKLTAEQFEEAMTPRTKMVILTTPNLSLIHICPVFIPGSQSG